MSLTLGELKKQVDALLAEGVPESMAVYSDVCDCAGPAGDLMLYQPEATRADKFYLEPHILVTRVASH
jgi:hypothetical protein